MNDTEFAELLGREQRALQAGWMHNDYTCGLCLSEGKTEMNSTYLDWPVYFVNGKPICDRHAEFILSRATPSGGPTRRS